MSEWVKLALAENTNQREGVLRAIEFFGAECEQMRITSHWTVLKLVGGSIVMGEVAVWNETGNVYALGRDGAVEDDPFITLRPARGLEGAWS